ncbi:MAG: hypothetical protein ABEJ03_04050 [Candidatus Nanohaloarchaea archaeon]
MVRWKGDIERSSCGEKASRLDRADSLNVPNFFVLTEKETSELADRLRSSESVEDVAVPEEVASRVKDAYREVDMSSAVRNASGQARNLVGGQRKGSRVSIRISGSKKGVYDYRLNAGSSDLEEGLKQVVKSYVERRDGSPAVLFQRMIEPEATGAAVLNYSDGGALLEAVKGLGNSLEEGVTVPELYLVGQRVKRERVPDRQKETSINPMSGDLKKKEVERQHGMFSKSEIESFVQSLRNEGASAKFAYKRGTFYVVDVFERGHGSGDTGVESIQATEKKVGRAAERRNSVPEKVREDFVSSTGGYTSSAAQIARRKGLAAELSRKDMKEGGNVQSGEKEEEIGGRRQKSKREHDVVGGNSPVTATEVLKAGSGLRLRPPYTGKLNVTEGDTEGRSIPRSGYVKTGEEALCFDGDKLVLDARNLSSEAANEAIEYLDPEVKAVILEPGDADTIRSAVRNRYDYIATGEDTEKVERAVAREERKILLDHATENRNKKVR